MSKSWSRGRSTGDGGPKNALRRLLQMLARRVAEKLKQPPQNTKTRK